MLVVAGVGFVAVVLGVVWGLADAGRIEASGMTTTTVDPTVATTSTTIALTTTTSSVATPTTVESTTTSSKPDNTSSGNDDGGSRPTTPGSANRSPVIEDPGISSDGMELTIAPIVSDPENEPVEVFFELDGSRMIVPQGATSATTTVDRGRDHVVGVSVTIGVTDPAGNEAVETFDHELQAITAVTVRDLGFSVAANSCFADEVAQRIVADIQLRGPVERFLDVSQELRADRSEVVFLEELTGAVTGEPPSQRVFVLPGLDGTIDIHDATYSSSEEVLITLFETSPCRGFLSYELEMNTR